MMTLLLHWHGAHRGEESLPDEPQRGLLGSVAAEPCRLEQLEARASLEREPLQLRAIAAALGLELHQQRRSLRSQPLEGRGHAGLVLHRAERDRKSVCRER